MTALAAPACEEEDDDTSDDSSSGGPTSETSAAGLECYDIPDMADCLAEMRFECRWDTEFESGCVPDCVAYADEATCNRDTSCEWDGSMCGMVI